MDIKTKPSIKKATDSPDNAELDRNNIPVSIRNRLPKRVYSAFFAINISSMPKLKHKKANVTR